MNFPKTAVSASRSHKNIPGRSKVYKTLRNGYTFHMPECAEYDPCSGNVAGPVPANPPPGKVRNIVAKFTIFKEREMVYKLWKELDGSVYS
ncbi:hypothetical protein DPMN_148120 [Dreissena polymorpha]|uniref:Uncharacterized protein n=1 Tax=Dreissena polymorpha TaxID=45954 RepID=A0A9D4J3N1_DREPO|nr:hypothetical protein DPMN_148120 [Dreissena polymorpha]